MHKHQQQVSAHWVVQPRRLSSKKREEDDDDDEGLVIVLAVRGVQISAQKDANGFADFLEDGIIGDGTPWSGRNA